MTDEKKAAPFSNAATQRMSKDELAELIKQAAKDDPDAEPEETAEGEEAPADEAKKKAP